MGKIEAETCSVCRENPAKYRCPGCAAPYCSLACNRAHKAGNSDGDNPIPPCTGKRACGQPLAQNVGSNSSGLQIPAGGKRPRDGDGAATSNGDGGIIGEDARITKACIRKGRDQWRGGREDKEEEEWQMSADQMERISGCMWLKAALRDPKLQGLLTEIDQAEDREGALAFHRTSTQFGDFMDKLLLEIEEYRKGGKDEPELVAADP